VLWRTVKQGRGIGGIKNRCRIALKWVRNEGIAMQVVEGRSFQMETKGGKVPR
jgi:hypothetical protein